VPDEMGQGLKTGEPDASRLRNLSPRAVALVALVLSAAAFALAIITGTARRTYRSLESASAQRQEAYEVLIELRLLRQHTGETRVGHSGYLLTHDSLYRATYEGGLAGIRSDTARLRALTADEPTLQRLLDEIEPKLAAFAGVLGRSLATMSDPERGTAPRPLAEAVQLRDATLLEGIRTLFIEMEREQTRLMQAGASAVNAAVARSNAIITWVLVGGIILIVGAGGMAVSQLYATARAQAQRHDAEREGQRLEAIGRLAGGVAHDFNNILSAVIGFGELLRDDLPAGDPRRSDMGEVLKAAERGRNLTRQLLAFSRRQVLQPAVLDLNQVIQDMGGMLARLLGDEIEVILSLTAGLGQVVADRSQIEQVIMNLAVNARDAMPDGGRLTIETRNVDLNEEDAATLRLATTGPHVLLEVIDTGLGMDEEVRALIFEPFFTTKETGKGTGLGLATAYGIVKQSGGHIWAYSEPGKGTTFKICLPRVRDATPTVSAAVAPNAKDLHGSETILLVEDDPAVLRMASQALQRSGYTVFAANGPEEAVAVVDAAKVPIRLLVSDVVMPGMTGPQLAQIIAQRMPGISVIYQSGYSDLAIAHHGLIDSGTAFLQKPYPVQVLLRTVREVLDAPRGVSAP
jgi:signal transduction histidine kinase/ActR/RegA family two-component response regulator